MEKRVKHLKRHSGAETIGWIGTGGVLLGYALASLGIASSNSLTYNLLFLVGSAGLAVVTYRHRAFQSFVVNITFVVLSTLALFRLLYL